MEPVGVLERLLNQLIVTLGSVLSHVFPKNGVNHGSILY
nr:MAG TPA: hypothetical protein [Caudoviricetes sp.]DAR25849.1 MAG TPA: hypothetical protein [Caudoviricetes sp.]DAR67283.1 MAG TPA: hypothetical protein [Caudoviricetes sp.]DAS32397.1 MAG TPA: hypothetical protein [Caudoviricetes sp.]DAU63081.1 MAG TPA: hypothetical protein [Caudoviricetes sp.]